MGNLASYLIKAGDAWINRGAFLKALTFDTTISRYLPMRGSAHLAAVMRRRVFWGRLLIAYVPGVPLSMVRSIAMLAEGEGDEKAFIAIMRAAFRRARQQEGSLGARCGEYEALFDFHLSIFDFTSARRVVTRALDRNILGADRLADELNALEREVAEWRDLVEQAFLCLKMRVAGQVTSVPRGDWILIIPSQAFRRYPEGYTGFRSDIRSAFKAIVSSLKAQSQGISVGVRLATHGVITPSGNRFVSYHTIGGDGLGLHIKETDRRGHFSIDPLGYSGWSQLSQAQSPYEEAAKGDAVDNFIAGEQAALIGGNQSKYDQPDMTKTDLPKTYVFVALQIIDDAVQRLASLHMFDMLEEVARTCAQRKIPLIVKRHPRCQSIAVDFVLKRGQRRGLFTISQLSVHQLIAGSCAVCVVNSSVGAEALLHHKPVYCFGQSEYQAAAYQIRTRGSFDAIFEPHRLPVKKAQINELLYRLRNDYSANVNQQVVFETAFSRKTILL